MNKHELDYFRNLYDDKGNYRRHEPGNDVPQQDQDVNRLQAFMLLQLKQSQPGSERYKGIELVLLLTKPDNNYSALEVTSVIQGWLDAVWEKQLYKMAPARRSVFRDALNFLAAMKGE